MILILVGKLKNYVTDDYTYKFCTFPETSTKWVLLKLKMFRIRQKLIEYQIGVHIGQNTQPLVL